GRPPAASGGHASAQAPAHATRRDLHPRRQPDDPDGVAAVPAAGGLSTGSRREPNAAEPAIGGRASAESAKGAPRRRPSHAALTGMTETTIKRRRDQSRRSPRGAPGWIPLSGPACPT